MYSDSKQTAKNLVEKMGKADALKFATTQWNFNPTSKNWFWSKTIRIIKGM